MGSDQLWSVDYGIPDEIASLSFVEKVKVSYAASGGNNPFSIETYPLLCKHLDHYDLLSAREERTRKEIQKYTNKEVFLHYDPAFLLTEKQWSTLAEKYASNKTKNISKNPFLLVYWIFDQDAETKKSIRKLAESLNLKIITIRSGSRDMEDGTYVECGPYDFVYLIEHCSFVVSKSFHGTVFSLIFNKPFYSFDSVFKKSNGVYHDPRLLRLIKDFSLIESHFINDFSIALPDYEPIEKKQMELIGEARDYFLKMLQIGDNKIN
jgi:polysaccharide pyruvyl transferase WcaK-like protein